MFDVMKSLLAKEDAGVLQAMKLGTRKNTDFTVVGKSEGICLVVRKYIPTVNLGLKVDQSDPFNCQLPVHRGYKHYM